jgi:hypothetical protein
MLGSAVKSSPAPGVLQISDSPPEGLLEFAGSAVAPLCCQKCGGRPFSRSENKWLPRWRLRYSRVPRKVLHLFQIATFSTERQLDTELIINAIPLQLFANPAARHFTAYLRHIFRELYSLGPSNGVRVNKKGGLRLRSFKHAIAAVYPKRQTCRPISSDQAGLKVFHS